MACCAVPNGDAIRSALDAGKEKKALELAKDDARSLDYLAGEILRRAATDEELSERALTVLGQARTRIKPLLRELASVAEDPVVRASSQSLLMRMGDRSHEGELVKALDSDLGLVRAAAVTALLTMEQKRGFHERYLLDTEPEVRMAVVGSLGSGGYPYSQELLRDAARKDPEPGIRAAALRALDPEAEENRDVLREALESDAATLRIAAVTSLGRSPASTDITWAAHLLSPPATSEGIHFAVALVGTDAAHEEARSFLSDALADPSPQVRLSTLTALTGAGMEVDGLSELASDPSHQVRVAWCRLSRKLGTSKMKKRLEILEAVADQKDAPREVLVALAEEKGGYEGIRHKVWALLVAGPADVQRYILVHANRPFQDPALAIWGMKSQDPEIRLQAAAAWLMRK
jgi:HEAT repeat protein